MIKIILRGAFAAMLALVQATIIAAMVALPAIASQNNLWNPTSGTLSGLTMVQNYNNALDSANTCNSGGTAPANQLSGSPSPGNCWADTSTSGWIKRKFYDGANWIVAYFVDTTNHYFTGIVGGGAINSVAAATTTDLCSVNPAYLSVTGVAAITSFGATCQTGVWKRIQFAGALTLTYNATSLILPTAANIVTANGDTADVVALGGGNWIVTHYQRATGAPLSTVGLGIGASALGGAALGSLQEPVNLGISTSVASNALTVTVAGANGLTPSATNPVLIPFRSATLATGTPVIDTLTATLSLTATAGNTMGCTSNVACRIWIYAIDNGGAIALGLMTCSNATQIFSCSDDLLYNTAAGTTNGGSSNGVLYGTTASLSGKAARIIGYLEVTETTAGTWATAPSKLQLMGPGVPKPGQSVQDQIATSTSVTTNSGTTKSAALPSITIAPQSAANPMRIHAAGEITASATSAAFTQVYRNAGGNAGCSTPVTGSSIGTNMGSSITVETPIDAFDEPNTTSQQTYAVCIWTSVGGANASYCQPNTGGVTGQTSTCWIEVHEIMGALDPTGDNPLSRRDLARLIGVDKKRAA